MSENAENTIYHQPTLFVGASHASLTVLPGSEEARKMTAISGLNIAGLLESADPVGLLVKMCLESEQPYSTRCYLTWKVWTTPSGRLLFRLAPSMPRTGEKEYSLLPTATVMDAYGVDNNPGVVIPTKRSLEKYERGEIARIRKTKSPNLTAWVNLWPTPQARDYRSGTGTETSHGKHAPPLSSAVGGLLNPRWVEWLMGFPDGWTDLEPSETP